MDSVARSTTMLGMVDEGKLTNLLISGEDDVAIMAMARDRLPDAPVIHLHSLKDVHDLFIFRLLNRNETILIDTGNFFSKQSPYIVNKVAVMLKQACERTEVHNFCRRNTFKFQGNVVIVTRDRAAIPPLLRNRMIVVNHG